MMRATDGRKDFFLWKIVGHSQFDNFWHIEEL